MRAHTHTFYLNVIKCPHWQRNIIGRKDWKKRFSTKFWKKTKLVWKIKGTESNLHPVILLTGFCASVIYSKNAWFVVFFLFLPWSGCPDHGRKMAIHSGAKSNKVVGSIPRSLLSAEVLCGYFGFFPQSKKHACGVNCELQIVQRCVNGFLSLIWPCDELM